jgi:outer membrane protein assembly factor BamB
MRRPSLALPPVAILTLCAALAGCGSSGSGSSSARESAAGESAAASGAVAPAKPLSGAVAGKASPLGAWPEFASDPRHGGAAAVVGPQSAHLLWKRKLEGAVVPGPAVGAGGVVYAASNGGVLHAIDLASGHDRWTFDGGGTYGSDLSTVPALTEDGTVLWPGPNDTLFALSPAGKLLWRVTLSAQPLSPLVMEDGSVVVGDMSGTVEDLTLRSGGAPAVKWKAELGGTSYSSPALGPEGTVYTATEEDLFAIRDGKVAWKFPASSPSEVSPAVAPDGTVVFGTNDSEYGISPGGVELWRHENGTRTYSSPIVTAGGLAYYGDNHGFVTVLDAASGELEARVGSEKPPGVWTAAAVDSKHDVYFGTAAGDIEGIDAAGHQLFDLEVGAKVDSYPALAADGTLLIGSENGYLYALGG